MAACKVLEESPFPSPLWDRPRRLAKRSTRAEGVRGEGSSDFYTWDLLNRMLTWQLDSSYSATTAVHYKYRADGMRVRKSDQRSSPTVTTDYFHDGQMCVQDTSDDGTDVTVTKYGAGMRGIDVITRKVNSGSETFGYPLYDTHGNMVATLARAPTNDFSTGNAKSYDVWGGDRSGSSSVDQGYVANLGHRTDSESGLQYMRARYYESSTGRFVNEDMARDGLNWFIYAGNAPTFMSDFSGEDALSTSATFWNALYAFVTLVGNLMGEDLPKIPEMLAKTITGFFAIMKNFQLGDRLLNAGYVVMNLSKGISGWAGVGFFLVGFAGVVGGALLKVTAIIQFANLMFDLHVTAIDVDRSWWF